MKKIISCIAVIGILLTAFTGVAVAETPTATQMYVNFNSADGAQLTGATSTQNTVTAIGNTGLYGYAFTAGDSGFLLKNTADLGVSATDIDNGKALQVTMEVYFTGRGAAVDKGSMQFASVALSLFGGSGTTPWNALVVNSEDVPCGEKVTYTFLLGKDTPYGDSSASAKKVINGEDLLMYARGYNNVIGKNPMYLLSLKVEKECEHSHTHLVNAVEATDDKAGYSGDTVCDDCGITLNEGRYVPPLKVVDFMQIDFNTAGDPLLIGVGETNGTATAIPNTDLRGFRFDYDWHSFTFTPGNIGVTPEDIENGTELQVTVEFYMVGGGAAAYPQIALSAGTGAPAAAIVGFDGYCHWDNVQVNTASLPLGERATLTFTLGKNSPGNLAELAKQLVSSDSAAWTGHCYSDLFSSAPFYLLSFTISDASKADVVCEHENLRTENATEPTCTEDGYSGDTVCEDCGATMHGSTIPKHAVEFREAQDATCIANGRAAGEWCTVCNRFVSGGETIPAHETVTVNERPRSCAEAGYSGDIWCTVCDTLVAAGVPTGTLPHTWDEGAVTKEATPEATGEFTVTCTVCGATVVTDIPFVPALGDVDGNGKVDSTDARPTLQYAVQKISSSQLGIDEADVDGNGKVDSTDARLILQYAVKKIDAFPAT